ncbi:hypothetical protein OA099_04255 [Litorivicinus sp.]|nr:hypothetical protein [Litorivicinus sp.]
MEECSFVFSPAIADQGTLEAQLRIKNAKNLVITPTTDEQGETEFRIWTFEGGENIHNIKAGLAGYFLAVGEEGSVTVKTKNQADQLWQFDSQESGLRGLNTDADQIVGRISGGTDIDDLDVATVPQDALSEEVSLIFSPATADELALKASLDNHNVNRYTVSPTDVDDETEFRIDLREDELQAARGALAEFFVSKMGCYGFVEVKYASGKAEEWEFNDELDIATVPQDPLPEEVSLIFSPATADELALKASLDNHNVNLYTVFSNDVDDEAEFRIDLWEDELWAARRALAEFFVSKIGCYGFVEVKYASGRTEEWEFNDELDVAAVPSDPLSEEVSLIFSPATADELALKNSLDDNNVRRYTVSSNDFDDDETEFRIDLREDELQAARGALAEFFVSKIGCYGFVEVKYASGRTDEWEFE